MRVRALDTSGDWEFGKGANDYKSGNAAIAQNIQTRLKSFIGDCFFDVSAGIDWFNLLGSKNELKLNIAISTIILNTKNVTGILQVSTSLFNNRILTVNYRVQTTLSQLSNQFQYDLGKLA